MAIFNKVKTGRIYVRGNRVAKTGGITDLRGQSFTTCGAGAIGTAFTPRTRRWTQNGIIINEYEVDITGLKCKGDAANDVIALTGAGYLDRITTATHGLVFRAEMSCLELPTQGTATITLDIDLGYDTLATLEYDGAADGPIIAAAGNWALNNTKVQETCATVCAANNYIYLTEGDTTASTGVYSGGQFLIRLYGHAALA